MRKFLSLFSVLMLTAVLTFGQSRTVTGRVTDANGAPVAGASVTVVGTNQGTSTNNNGEYSITVPANGRLEVSGVGLETKRLGTGVNTSINFDMSASSGNELTAVVVTALGVQRQARELGYSTAKIKAAELTQAKTVNLQNGLTGKVSGLNIQTVNNGVFANTRITLRGIRSLTGNNQPMLVLDGVPISLDFISSINPNDILDVNILKSSSSTAIYGPDGVNGAIIVTTKQGVKGKPLVTISHTTQFEKVAYMPLFQTQFGSGSSENAFGQGVYDPIENQQYGDRFDGLPRDIGRVLPNGNFKRVNYSYLPNEKKKFWNVGVTNQSDVSYAAGDFYLSAQNVDIQGITPKDVNRRMAFKMSANKEYNRLKASYTVNYTQNNYNVTAGNFFAGRDYTPYWNLVNTPGFIPITEFKNWRTDDFANPNGYFNDYYHNPYWVIDNFRQIGRSDDVFGNIELNYKLASWLTATYRIGATYSGSSNKYTQEAFTYSAFSKAAGKSNAQTGDLVAKVFDDAAYSSRINSEAFLNATKTYGRFKLDALLGQSYRQITSKNQNLFVDNLGIPDVFNASVRKGDLIGGESNFKTRLERYFGKLAVGYNKWLFAEVTGSNDIDSRLANPYNFDAKAISFFYPGASLSVVATEAIPSLKSNTLSFLKFRGAVSKTGNVNLGPYQLENTFSAPAGFPFGNTLGFTANNVLRQSSYQPEFVKNTEVGVEIGMFKNRVNFEASAYRQRNTNQIITVAYSAATGYPQALLNAADFTNKGLEFDLRLTPLISLGDFNVDFKVNYTYQTNKVNSLVNGVDELAVGNLSFVRPGQPAYIFKVTDYVRDSATGKVIVDRTTGLPTINPVVSQKGSSLPNHLLGLNLNVNYKNLSLSVVADYRSGNLIYSGIGPDMDFTGLSVRSGQNGRQPFLFPNSVYRDGTGKVVENTDIYTTGGYNFWSQAINTAVESNYLTSGAFWKLREIALSYTFPQSMFSGKAIKGVSVAITGRNLLTWLPKTNEFTDPEFSNTTGNAQGVNNINNTPPTRIFGANVTFQF